MSNIINGREIAQKIRNVIKGEVLSLIGKGVKPCLHVVLIGDDPASQVYVRNKEKACAEVGIISVVHRLSGHTTQIEAIELIRALNNDAAVHGILVQLPLPVLINANNVLAEISPKKDVDGLHPVNLGKLVRGEDPFFISCTPSGIIELIKHTGVVIKGKDAVVVGRSNIVGKPVALLLLDQHATVTICHSRTQDLKGHCRRADILVFAVGKPKIADISYIKPGAVVIDVGTTKTNEGFVGDVDFDSAKDVAGWITPVPGGVGPLTIAMLLKNTVKAARINSVK